MRVVFAPDSFKASATALQAAEALAAGWASVRPGDDLLLRPMADGGEGTLDAVERAVPGATRMPVVVRGPEDRPVEASWLLLPNRTGLVELASTSGLTLLEELRPLTAHTIGFGQAIAAALDHDVERLLLAIGGSSSTDGGAGALRALGARFVDREGVVLPPGGGALERLAAVELSAVRGVPAGGAQVLTDVTNPLLGPHGAASVFGPQKGAAPAEVTRLENGLHRLAELLPADPAAPGAGAAGGCGFALIAWGAVPAAGSRAIGEAIGLPAAVADADIVITGEGRFDAQSAAGKVPSYVAGVAASAGVPALLVAGSVGAQAEAFAHVRSLVELAGRPESAIAEPQRWLREAAASLAASV